MPSKRKASDCAGSASVYSLSFAAVQLNSPRTDCARLIDLTSGPLTRSKKYLLNALEEFPEVLDAPPSNKQQRTDDNFHGAVRISIPHTGRMVFTSKDDDISDMYRAFRQTADQQRQNRREQQRLETEEKETVHKLDRLELNESSASSSRSSFTAASNNKTGGKHTQGSGRIDRNINQTKPQSAAKSKPPEPTLTPSSASGKSTGNAGRAAAMARIAAAGDEWPEEEDLPGMSAPSSSVLQQSGTLSRSANKQFNNALQRQKKVATAKKQT